VTEQEVKKLNAKVPELMGATEVAKVLGVNQQNLNKVARLPEHVTTLSRGRVWRADVIHAFARKRAEG
jgi:hypothetical protein